MSYTRTKRAIIFSGIVALLCILPIPLIALAGDFKAGEEKVVVNHSEVINDDLYIAGGEVTIDGTVNGDVFAAGGRVIVSGTITGDLFIASGQALIRGTVSDDLRIGAGDVIIEGTVGDDVVAAAGSVTLSKNASVGGDIHAQAGQVTVSGTTGSIYANTGTLAVEDGARVRGSIEYSADRQATIASGAVEGQVKRNMPSPEKKERGMAYFVTATSVVSLLIKILMGVLLIYVVPVKVTTMTTSWKAQFGHNLLWGFLFLIGAPALGLLLLISVIGMPLGIALVLLYPIVLYLGSLLGMIGAGFWIQTWWGKGTLQHPDWISVVFGGIILWVLKLIPVIGWVVAIIVFLSGLGAILRFDWGLYKRLRSQNVV